jgi:succinate dehydrogenase / fumarate reductase flavoprotein subunit
LSVLEILCNEAPQEALRLDHLGVPFARSSSGTLALRQLNGSRTPRAVFAADFTGHVVLHTLYEQLLKAQIPIYDEWQGTSLIIDEGQCHGVLALEQRTSNLAPFAAQAVILATGGAGRVYQRSTASRSCTGDGLSLAYRAGVPLVDMEMVQYHPLGFHAHRVFASEATLSEGAVLFDTEGQPVLLARPQCRAFLLLVSVPGRAYTAPMPSLAIRSPPVWCLVGVRVLQRLPMLRRRDHCQCWKR